MGSSLQPCPTPWAQDMLRWVAPPAVGSGRAWVGSSPRPVGGFRTRVGGQVPQLWSWDMLRWAARKCHTTHVPDAAMDKNG